MFHYRAALDNRWALFNKFKQRYFPIFSIWASSWCAISHQVLMEDSFYNPTPGNGTKSAVTAAVTKNESKWHSTASGSKSFANIRQIDLIKYGKQRRGSDNQLVFFLVKVAALETVRRISQSKCPFVWSGLQALQVVCYPPLKWMQRWNPFRVLVEGMQVCMQLSNSEELILCLVNSSRCIQSLITGIFF